MNIIIPDIDIYIINFLDLPSMANLLCTNTSFLKIISTKPIMSQWKNINNAKLGSIESIFLEICKRGFLEYVVDLFNRHEINIHADNDNAFQWSCGNGHLTTAQWLIKLGESNGYGKFSHELIKKLK